VSRVRTEQHVEFYSKNKFEKLVHLVGFIIRICHDARSHDCKKSHIKNPSTKSQFKYGRQEPATERAASNQFMTRAY